MTWGTLAPLKSNQHKNLHMLYDCLQDFEATSLVFGCSWVRFLSLANVLSLRLALESFLWSFSSYGFKFWFWFGLMLNIRVNNFSVMLGLSYRFLGITSTFLGVNMSCSRTQHGDPSGARTPHLWIRSPRCLHRYKCVGSDVNRVLFNLG